MIYTLTTNPAIDFNLSTHGLVPNSINRTHNTVYTANGKGINVSYVLAHYQIPSKILGFFGDFSGHFIVNQSRKKGFDVLPIWIKEPTRINVFVNDGTSEYKFLNAGPFVSVTKQNKLLQLIEDSDDMDVLVISGSLPQGINSHYYHKIAQICQIKKVKLILDISSLELKNLLQYRPFLIKPNEEEIKDIFGSNLHSEKDVQKTLASIHHLGAQNILLTMGEKGAYFSNGQTIFYASSVPIKVVSSACAGDASLAGFLSIWLKKPTLIEEALRRSVATGANVAESNALGDFKHVEAYLNDIHIRRVKE